jgi:hypothetical protein
MPFADVEPIPNKASAPAVKRSTNGANVYAMPVQPPSTPPARQPIPQPNFSQQGDNTLVGGGMPSVDATMVGSLQGQPVLTFIKAPAGVGTVGQRTGLSYFPFTIGRKDAALTINDISISRLHGQISADERNNTFWYEDLNSSNGSFINGRRLAAGQPVQLSNGTQLRLGPNVEIKFEII